MDILSDFERSEYAGAVKAREDYPAWFVVTAEMVVLGFLSILDRFGEDHKPSESDGGGCIYAERQSGVLKPVCIVGQLFSDWGILGALMNNPDVHVESYDQQACNLANVASAVTTLAMRGIFIEEGAYILMVHAQSNQDAGVEWGGSVDAALRKAAQAGFDFVGRRSLLDKARDWRSQQ